MVSPRHNVQSSKVLPTKTYCCFRCNGSLPGGDTERRRSRFVLYRRKEANGVRPSTVHSSYTPQAEKAVSSRLKHSVSFSLSRKHSVVVEYVPDSSTDMFQIGRSSEEPIDFMVTGRAGSDPAQSSVSRFCCRILCSREPPYSARIYAAGFDSAKNIALGERATKWRTMDGQMDALTTNGVLVMNPGPGFTGLFQPGLWKEVSVCGNIFTLRETRSAQKRGARVKGESNLLFDGSLVDLCGVTLLWRSSAGLSLCPTDTLLESHRQDLNSARPQCPVGFYTLSFPSRPLPKPDPEQDPNQPWVYVRCGHVHGYHVWGRRSCPMCRTRSAYVPLWLGLERGFYVDSGKPTHALVPCGHVCSHRTAVYWSLVRTPHLHASCPFCLNPLDAKMPHVQLIFQSPID
uniref:Pellino n=1 Tax=Neogobius melanostomus TaxID=47308 RepID=A0A8C6TH86_9GOBI